MPQICREIKSYFPNVWYDKMLFCPEKKTNSPKEICKYSSRLPEVKNSFIFAFKKQNNFPWLQISFHRRKDMKIIFFLKSDS